MKLILSGSIAIDRIMVYPGKFIDVIQPDKLHVLSISLLLEELQETRGGVAANIAYSLALLGEKPVLYGSVGDNARGYMDDLAGMGIDTSLVHYSEKPTAAFTVMTDQTDCQIGGFYSGAMGDAASLSVERFKDDDILMVVSPHDPVQMARQVAECKQLGKRLFYDVGQQASNIGADDIRSGIEAAELLIVNDYEMGVLEQKTGWSAADIKSKVKVCVVTLGEQGCVVSTAGKEEKISAAKVGKVVDPTGAGDAFRAGFLYGYIRNYKPTVCAQLGAVTAVYAVEHKGTQGHSFTLPEIQNRYQASYGQKWPQS